YRLDRLDGFMDHLNRPRTVSGRPTGKHVLTLVANIPVSLNPFFLSGQDRRANQALDISTRQAASSRAELAASGRQAQAQDALQPSSARACAGPGSSCPAQAQMALRPGLPAAFRWDTPTGRFEPRGACSEWAPDPGPRRSAAQVR